MSDASVTISRDPLPEGQDYATLLDRGIELVQSLSGKVWTNYNASDPGLTILQQLCYALTELSYRAQFPVEQLLAPGAEGHLVPQLHGLLPPEWMLPRSPVTAADHARLLLDRVAGLAHCWFTPVLSAAGEATGLYDVTLLAIEPEGASSDLDDAQLSSAVRDCYAAHRALCEDLRTVQQLRPVTTDVAADVHLSQQADPDDVLAQLLFRLHLRLAPEPRRSSLQDRLSAGMETSRIFSGPAMERGFITDEQLGPQPGPTPVADLLDLMVMTAGVLEVGNLAVHLTGERKTLRDDDTIVPVPGTYCRLRTRPVEGRFGIRLHCGAARIEPNPRRVQRLFVQYLAGQRRTCDLRAEVAAHYQRPQVRHMDLATYTSVQEQFPAVYGIGAHGLPKEATDARKAQALQLKGYLMPFDQLMADHFAQLASIGELFSVAAGGRSTYAWQSLAPIVPGAAELLEHEYAERHAQDVARADPVLQRQSAMLDFLLSLYARTLPRPPLSRMADVEHFRQTCLRTQQDLMARIVAATAGRGRGFDARAPHGHALATAGLEIVARAELRLLLAAQGHRPPHEVDDPAAATFGQRLHPEDAAALAHAEPLEAALAADMHTGPAAKLRHLAGRAAAGPLLKALAEPRHYRLLPQGGPGLRLVCGSPEHGWWTLGDFAVAEAAIEQAATLVREACWHRHVDSLYIVEWVLLRFALPRHGEGEVGHPFRVTAVLAALGDECGPGRGDPPPAEIARRQSAQAIVRDNLPAHAALDCLFLHPPEMAQFAALHGDWVEALRDPEAPARRAAACRALMGFLQRHLPQPAPAATPLDAGSSADPSEPQGDAPLAVPVAAAAGPAEPDVGSSPGDRLHEAVNDARAKLEQEAQELADAARARLQEMEREAAAKLADTPLGQVRARMGPGRGDDQDAGREMARGYAAGLSPGTTGTVAPHGGFAPSPRLRGEGWGEGRSSDSEPVRALDLSSLSSSHPPLQGAIRLASRIRSAGSPQAARNPGFAPPPSPAPQEREPKPALPHSKSQGLANGSRVGDRKADVEKRVSGASAPAPAAMPVPVPVPAPASASDPAPAPAPVPPSPPWRPPAPSPAGSSTDRPWSRLLAWVQQRRAASARTAAPVLPGSARNGTPAQAPANVPSPSPVPSPAPSPTLPPASSSNAVRHGRPGDRGFDCNQKLTEATAQQFRQAGFVFALRYLSRSTPGASQDLTFDEASAITASGLGLMAVQHVKPEGWSPTAALGTSQGQAAAVNAQAAGLPPGINVWLDLEGVAPGTAAQDVVDYCNAWLAEVAAVGYLPGLYVGSNAGLDGEQLYEQLSFTYYWRSGSQVPDVATRGYCMVQTIDASLVLGGVAYDGDEVQGDQLGHVPVWALQVSRLAGEQAP